MFRPPSPPRLARFQASFSSLAVRGGTHGRAPTLERNTSAGRGLGRERVEDPTSFAQGGQGVAPLDLDDDLAKRVAASEDRGVGLPCDRHLVACLAADLPPFDPTAGRSASDSAVWRTASSGNAPSRRCRQLAVYAS